MHFLHRVYSNLYLTLLRYGLTIILRVVDAS
jgi:hypothetical protein